MMNEQLSIVSKVLSISSSCSLKKETWGSLNLTGPYSIDIFEQLKDLESLLKEVQCSESLKIKFDSDPVSSSDFDDYINNVNSFNEWNIVLNKESLLNKRLNVLFNMNFFLESVDCQKWLEEQNPLKGESKINALSPLKIIVCDLASPFGGEALSFLPLSEDAFSISYTNISRLPTLDGIKENVRFLGNYDVVFDPNTYKLVGGDFTSELAKCLLKKSCIALACCIVDEFYDFDSVVINGFKRVKLKLWDVGDNYDYDLNEKLYILIKWLYDEKTATRKKLFTERLSLEINASSSVIAGLHSYLTLALEQAKERYNFVILDRKDNYVKELKDLLKDLRSQSDLYSLKIRTLLSNFLRDVLAALVLIGFTIFTKFSDNIQLQSHQLLTYVFYGLSVYYVVSAIMQLAIDWVDIAITNKELKYWKNASKELIPEEEFDKRYKESLSPRQRSLYILYPIILLLYLLIAFACYKFPAIFEQILKIK
jgi:hypothetical protein